MKRLCIWLLAISPLFAAIEFKVSPQQVALNESVNFSIILTGDDINKKLTIPDGILETNFTLIRRNPTTNRSTSIINGKVSTRFSWTFHFQARSIGKSQFPQQQVYLDGKKYTSKATDIVVTKESMRNRRNRSLVDDLYSRKGSKNTNETEIDIEAKTSKNSYYLGEEIPLDYRIYVRNLRINRGTLHQSYPAYDGFWVEEYQKKTQENIINKNGKNYDELVFNFKRLYPSRTGELSIKPAHFEIFVSASGFFSNWQKVIRNTKPIKLNILTFTNGKYAKRFF